MRPLGPDQNSAPDDTAYSGIDVRFQAWPLDAVGQAVIVTDPQWKVAYWNRAAERLYGWSAEEVMSRPLLEVTLSADLTEQAEEIMTELMAGRSWTGEFVVRRKDGTPFSAHVTNTPVYDERGALVAIIGVSTDITELEKTDELRRSEERFRTLAQNTSDIVTLLGADGTIHYQSPSVEQILGYAPQEMLGENAFDYVHPEDLGRARSAMDYLIRALDENLTGVALLPGECLFIDNYKAVHGRSSFKARFDGTDRWLKRINITRDLRKSRAVRKSPASRMIL